MSVKKVDYEGPIDPSTHVGRLGLKIFIGTGILLLLVGIALIWHYHDSAKGYETVKGTMLGFNSQDKPVLEYTVDGVDYKMVSEIGGSFFRTGEEYKVLYDPAYPADARVGGMTYYVVPIAITALGLLILIFCVVVSATNKKVKGSDDKKVAASPAAAAQASPAPAPAGQTANQAAPTFCHICGQKLHPGSAYCGNCGARID